MDSFSDGNLPPDAKRDVIAYIESLNEAPEYGGFGLGGLGPVPEGLAAWVVGIGALVARGRVDRRAHDPDDQDQGRVRRTTSKDEAEAEVQA